MMRQNQATAYHRRPDHRNVAVAGPKCAPYPMQERMSAAGPARVLTRHRRVVQLEALGGDHRAIDRSIDALGMTRAFALEQGRQNAAGERERARLIGNRRACRERVVRRHAGLRHQTAGGLGERVAARADSPWAWPPGAALGEDDAGVQLGSDRHSPNPGAPELRAGNSSVRRRSLLGQPPHNLDAIRLLQIDGDTALATIHREVIMRHAGVPDVGNANQSSQ